MNPLLRDLIPFVPEGLLVLGLVVALLVDAATPDRDKRAVLGCALVAVLAAWVAGLRYACWGQVAVGGVFVLDGLASAARLGILGGGALVLASALGSRQVLALPRPGEYAIALLGLVLGCCLMAAARDLVALMVGIEAASLSGYVLAGFRARDRAAAEAGTKYLLFGSLATALMLFGMSHLFGLAGCLDLRAIGVALLQADPLAVAGPLLLVAAGLVYKLALVPFHFYAPDAYQGAPAVSAAAFSTLPKLAAVAVLARMLALLAPEGHLAGKLGLALAVLGSVSVLAGALLAAASSEARRILGFSAVVHAGSLVLALAVWPERGGWGALACYGLAYLLAQLGAFVALDQLEAGRELRGAWQRRPAGTLAFVLLLASLAGLPPFAGFLGKWLVLRSLAEGAFQGGWPPALAGGILLLGTLVALVGYLRVLRIAGLAGGCQAAEPTAGTWPAWLVVWICVIGSLGLWGVLPWLDGVRAALGG